MGALDMQPCHPHIWNMTYTLAPFALSLLLAMPAMAQDTRPQTSPETEEGLGLIDRGMRLLFENLMQDFEPAFGDMAEAMQKLEPMARELAALIGDVQNYDAPERLDNGDIIIRRKLGAPAPPAFPPPARPAPDAAPLTNPQPEGQIEL
jgi:hypothetical protein